eukprot:scpid25093/ scgid12592/ 
MSARGCGKRYGRWWDTRLSGDQLIGYDMGRAQRVNFATQLPKSCLNRALVIATPRHGTSEGTIAVLSLLPISPFAFVFFSPAFELRTNLCDAVNQHQPRNKVDKELKDDSVCVNYSRYYY